MKAVAMLSLLLTVIGIPTYAHAISNDVTLTAPTTVGMNGHQKNDIHVGEPVGFSSVITNHSTGEKRFTYVVRVMNQNNQIESLQGLSASIVPNQSFTVAQSWIPTESGTFKVQTFLLNGYLMSSPLTDIIETQITVK